MTGGVEVETEVRIDWTALGRDLAGRGSAEEQANLLNALGARLRDLGGDGALQALFIQDRLDGGGAWLLEQLADPDAAYAEQA